MSHAVRPCKSRWGHFEIRDGTRNLRQGNARGGYTYLGPHARGRGQASPEQIRARIDYYGGRCWMCGSPEADTLDHVIPLARGGTNWPANLRPACRSCNSRKHARAKVNKTD
jgi:5-methylcytosine-specific restriction endonuclease McrA